MRPILTQAGRKKLLWGDDHTPRLSTSITPAEVDRAHAEATAMPWTEEAREALESILKELAREGIRPGDRRQFKAVGVAKSYAWLCGADHVEPEHLEVLASVLWDDPCEQPQKASQVIARVANPTGMKVTLLLLECEQVLTAADPRNLAQAATAAAKLQEIDRQLGTLRKDARVERARGYVKEQVRKVKLASLDAI